MCFFTFYLHSTKQNKIHMVHPNNDNFIYNSQFNVDFYKQTNKPNNTYIKTRVISMKISLSTRETIKLIVSLEFQYDLRMNVANEITYTH